VFGDPGSYVQMITIVIFRSFWLLASLRFQLSIPLSIRGVYEGFVGDWEFGSCWKHEKVDENGAS
jgi:hypothetical protein